MKKLRRTTLWLTAFLCTAGLAVAHPGHAGHDLTVNVTDSSSWSAVAAVTVVAALIALYLKNAYRSSRAV
ncbi:MAG: hypothetical protein Q7S40_23090 [Opitutaceae bacterium]|nr:hypothetical protein [Opitutaceae bacterium]